MSTQENATTRLGRLLTMVPYLVQRQGISIEDAAHDLGVSPAQIEADLSLLFLCGTPGHMPDDLIEAEWEDGRVYLRNADTIARPLRLNRDEALALIVGLRALADVPGLSSSDAIERALVKLTEAGGDAAAQAGRVQIDLAADDAAATSTLIQQALNDHRRVHLQYLVAARDERTERDVDPMRLVNADGRWYLEGWCHLAQDVRLFRLDRIESLEILDVDGTPPPEATPRPLDGQVFEPSPDDPRVVLDLAPGSEWVAEYYPTDDVQRLAESAGGGLRVTLRATDMRWVRALVWRLGGGARVVDPPELADDVRRGAARTLEQYGVPN